MPKLYIETLGCAMNVRDSEHMIAELESKRGYSLTSEFKEADLILINTCSVRERPEHKLFSEIGNFVKRRKPGAKIGVCGCTASHMGAEILKKATAVDFVLGARNVSKITDIIDRPGAVEVDIDFDESLYPFASKQTNPYRALINISIGCDKKCAYCIVPATRGEEISIPPDLIATEVERAVQNGAKEVLLLGQNVNNYGRRFSQQQNKTDFTALLQMIGKIPGVERIRFVSPHPLHMDDTFIKEFAANPKICKSIHMPLQSGSTEILAKMRRGYSQENFLERAHKIKEACGKCAIGTDIIVGFPGESDDDFEATMHVIEQVRFEQIFSFKYSPRPHTEAIHFTDTVDDAIASRRLTHLQNRHTEILDELAQKEMGQHHLVLFENIDSDGWLEGRNTYNRLIKAKGDSKFLGHIAEVNITEPRRMSLTGKII